MTTPLRARPWRPVAALVGLLVGAGLALGLAAGPAGAHDGDAVITVEAVHPAGQSVHYIVRVVWADDGHPAAGATVTATGVAADGTQLTPVPLAPADSDGRYSGAVQYPSPGAWTVRITAIDPTGSVEQPQEVVATPATEAPSVTTGEGAGGGFAPADDGTGPGDEAGGDGATPADGSGGDSDDSSFPVVLVVAAAAVVVIGAITAVNTIRRTRANPPAEAPGGAPGGGPDTGADAGPANGDAPAGPPAGTTSEATTG